MILDPLAHPNAFTTAAAIGPRKWSLLDRKGGGDRQTLLLDDASLLRRGRTNNQQKW
jgi:hypothetical protein